jgi:hypothetical protein
MADDIKFVIGVDDRDLIKAQKEQLKFQRNLITIEQAYRKGDITAKRYNAELSKQARELQKLGGSYNKASSEVRKFAYQLRTADDSALAASQSYAFAGKNVNRMGMQMQQAGYQIGDFAVQVQGGTNVMVALGQQGAQLLGIFGAKGAIAGAALAIATAFIAPLFKAKQEAKKLGQAVKQEMKDIEAEFKKSRLFATTGEMKFIENIAKLQIELDELNKQFKDGGGAAAQTASQVYLSSAIRKTQEELSLANKEFQTYQTLVAKIAMQGPLDAFGGEGYDHSLALEEFAIRYDILKLQEIENRNGQDSVVYLKEAMRQRVLAENKQIDLLGLSEDHTDELTALNLEIETFNLKLATSVINSANLARNLETAATFNTGGVGGEFADVPTGLDAFGGGGDYKYDLTSSFRPSKEKKTSGTKESPQEKLAKYLQGKQQELTLEKQLVGVFDEERQVQTELFNIKNQYAGVITPQQEKELESILRLTEAEKERQAVIEEAQAKRVALENSITQAMETGFMAMIDGTMSVKDAFKSMAAEIIKELYRVLVVQQMVNAAKGFFGFEDGGAFSGGSQVQAYADGGVVGSPTTFPMAGGKTGLMGEAGPEAIMPLKRGANGKLGVQMEGGSQGNVVINQSFNFQANGDDSVKKLIAQAAPKIADMAKASVIESRRRGGSTKAAFG